MNWNFDQLAERQGTGNMKLITTPENIKRAGSITYSGAEMDFPTAPVIIRALQKRAESGLYGYTIVDEQYEEAVIGWLEKRRNWKVKREWIVPTYGTMQAIGLALRACTERGDGVIVQPPVYLRYFGAIERNGRKVVYNPLVYSDGAYKIDYAGLEQLMQCPENRLLLFCNPHNPVGKVWGAKDLKRIATLARRYDVQVVSDEIFGEVTFGDLKTPPFNIVLEEAIVCTSLGKTFNFTGFSHCNVIISSPQVRERFVIQRDLEHYGSLNPFMRDAVIAAYTEGEEWFLAMLDYVYQNYCLLKQILQENKPAVLVTPLEGTFTAWLNWRALGKDEQSLQRLLVEQALLATDAGTLYGPGGEGFSRINLATPRAYLEKSLARLVTILG